MHTHTLSFSSNLANNSGRWKQESCVGEDILLNIDIRTEMNQYINKIRIKHAVKCILLCQVRVSKYKGLHAPL